MLSRQWIRSFAALAEIGSFTGAADRLDLTQAAVSQHVRHLEQRLGRLLVRRPRAIALTPAGEALLAYARELEDADRRLLSRVADAASLDGELGLITPGSVGLLLYPMLLDLQAEHPRLVVRHRFAPDGEVLDAVLHNRFEVGLATLRPDDPRLAASRFGEEPLELVVPTDAEAACWDDLMRLGFIDHPDGQAMASRLLSQCFPQAPGIRAVPCRGFSNQVGLILEPVARGLGFTVIPRYARAAFADQAAIRVVRTGPPVVDTLWMIHRAEWPMRRRTAGVMRMLRDRCIQAEVPGR